MSINGYHGDNDVMPPGPITHSDCLPVERKKEREWGRGGGGEREREREREGGGGREDNENFI